MKYYRINNSCIKEVIGDYPQVYKGVLDFNIYDENSAIHLNFSEANEFTLWPISLLSTKAKKTDLISNSFMSLSATLFVSAKLKNIFDNCNYKGIQFIKSKLIVKNNIEEEYWIINPYQSDYSFLDVHKSEFVFKDRMLSKITNRVKFDGIEEFLAASKKNNDDAIKIGYPNFNPLVLNNIAIKEDCGIDFFSITKCNYGIGYFVSENLKTKVEEAGCTGIVFTEPNERYP